MVNLLQAFRNIERDQKEDAVLPKNTIFVEFLKSCLLKGSSLTALMLLNKRTQSVNSAYNSIMPSRLLRNVKLRPKVKRIHAEEQQGSARELLDQATRLLRSMQIALKKGRAIKSVALQAFRMLLLFRETIENLPKMLAEHMHESFLLESIFSKHLTSQCQNYSKQINDDDPELFFQAKPDSSPEIRESVVEECMFWITSMTQNVTLLMNLKEEFRAQLRLAESELALFAKNNSISSTT